jgi:translation initiation factor 3 subunit E
LLQKREHVVEKLHEFEETIDPIVQLFEDPEVQEYLEQKKEDLTLFEYLSQNHDFKPEMVDLVYNCAKFKYECGNYTEASEYLYFYRVLAPSDHHNSLSGMWGRLSCYILVADWESALEELNNLRKHIDDSIHTPHLLRLQQRSWLIHWSLFVFFNHAKGQDDIIELLLYKPDYLNAIHTSCPHILRYITAAVITNKRRQSILKDLIRVIKRESHAYRDPITEFVECLYIKFDFDMAQQKLIECEKVLDKDFFLVACRAEFIENARLCIFETFCRIHQCISISMLATKLNLSEDDAERWIVNLIRNARLDAKIDAKEGHVIMMSQPQSIYQKVIDKTKGLAFQAQFLAQSIDKRLKAQIAKAQSEISKGFPPLPVTTQHWAPTDS